MIVSKEEFVKRIYAKILAKNVFLEKLPFNMNTLLKTNETAEWVAHMVLEDVVLVDAGKWEALKQHLARKPIRCWGFFDKDATKIRDVTCKDCDRYEHDNCFVYRWFEELERLVNEKC